MAMGTRKQREKQEGLWIDPARGVSVQQKFAEPSGDYRVAKYSNIEINHKISGDVFKLKTTGHTKVIKPS